MKKRILSIILALAVIFVSVPLGAIPVLSLSATLGDVIFTVGENKDAGLNGDVKIVFSNVNGNYKGTLYLPGNADTSRLTLSWDDGVTVYSGATAYNSGEAPVPAKNKTATYTVTAGGKTANFTVTTVQGSENVKSMFLNIDESYTDKDGGTHTIQQMNTDGAHEATCYGSLSVDGENYYMTVKGRGNTTWSDFEKKPYNITTYKKADYADKKKTELINGVEAKKWSILANAKDPTCLRNKIGGDIANDMGIGLPSESIDVWMNGEFLGNYLLTPKNDNKTPKNGYLVEIDNLPDTDQFTLDSIKFTVKDVGENPETGEDLTVSEVRSTVEAAFNALNKTDDSYLDYFDLDSWAKMYLLNELYKDKDLVAGSIFFKKESITEGKLTAGPIWDLDLTLGRVSNHDYLTVDSYTEHTGGGWYIDDVAYRNRNNNFFFKRLGTHASFMKRVYEIYNEYKNVLNGIPDNVDVQSSLIADSAKMNFVRWPELFVNMKHYSVTDNSLTFGNDKYAVNYVKTDTWEAYVANLKEYITKRLDFFSDKLTVTPPDNGSIIGNTQYSAGETLNLTAKATANGYQWQTSADGENWTDINGATANTYSAAATANMNGLKIRCKVRYTSTNIINTNSVAKAATGTVAPLNPVTLNVTLEGHEHNYQTVLTKPTCTEQGYTTYFCTCGAFYTDDYTDKSGHNFADGKCTRCGENDPARIPACITKEAVSLTAGVLTFKLGGKELGEYTFAKSGSGWTIKGTDGKYLSFSRQSFTYSNSPFVWTYSNNAFTATSGTYPKRTYYLIYSDGAFGTSTASSGSNAEFIKAVENANHTFTEVVTDPTCLKQGYTAHTCADCGFTYKDAYTDATGHSYGEWITVTAATCTNFGLRKHICSDCSVSETRVVPATGHTDTDQNNICDVCHEIIDNTIPTYSEVWNFNETHHWHDAICGDEGGVSDFAAHTFNEGEKNGNSTTYTCTKCGYNYTVTVVPGDGNGDGEINSEDLVLLRKGLLSNIGYNKQFDANGDGAVDIRDLVRLKKHIVDNTVPLGK